MELVFGQNGIELVHEKGNWELKKDFGFSPVETLVASIGACGAYVFEGMMKASSVPHEFVNVKISFENHEHRPHPLKEVTIDYYVKIDPEYRERAERIMARVPSGCPVMQSLSNDVVVNENIHYQ